MKIAIADAHRVFAEALATLLRKSGHDIAGWAADLDGMAGIIDGEQMDACVVDLGLPGSEDVAGLAAAMAAAPAIAFVFLAGSPDPDRLSAVVSAGARGVAMKSDDLVEILRVLHGAVVGRPPRYSKATAIVSMSAQTVLGSRRNGRRTDPQPGQFLTQREREVLASLVRGESTASMARSMGVRVSTARSHVDAVLTKLGAHTRIEAVACAVRAGLVDIRALPVPDRRLAAGRRLAGGLWRQAS
ncbi:MAG: response regulator transcription factor [Actinomycetota bacterium]|nr:response regulator transcription factor [Actinomycetota bacterium]